jgi:hypothetical protein
VVVQNILVERDEEIPVSALGKDRVGSGVDLQENFAAADDRLIGVVGERASPMRAAVFMKMSPAEAMPSPASPPIQITASRRASIGDKPLPLDDS